MLPESLTDALIEAVKACGGSKAVGVALWPAKGVEAAQRQLLACLNPDRQEKLSPDELLHVLRLARDRGCHVGMQYIAHALSYAEPVPVEPRDELADLQRQNAELLQAVLRNQTRMERIAGPVVRAAA